MLAHETWRDAIWQHEFLGPFVIVDHGNGEMPRQFDCQNQLIDVAQPVDQPDRAFTPLFGGAVQPCQLVGGDEATAF